MRARTTEPTELGVSGAQADGLQHTEAPVLPTLGEVIGFRRRRLGFTLDTLAEAMGYRGRAKNRRRLERLEDEDKPSSGLLKRLASLLELPPNWLEELAADHAVLSALQASPKARPRIVRSAGLYHQVETEETSSEGTDEERASLCANLGRLVERWQEIVMSPPWTHCRLSDGLLWRDPPSPKGWPGGDTNAPGGELRRTLSLGVLCKLWSEGALVYDDGHEEGPIHVVRAIGHSRSKAVVLEGPRRGGRVWVRRHLRGDRPFAWLQAALGHKEVQPRCELDRLRDRARLKHSARSALEARRRERERDTDLLAPEWARPFLSETGVRDLSVALDQSIETLEPLTSLPITSRRWSEEILRRSGVTPLSKLRWESWMEGRASSMTDAYRKRQALNELEAELEALPRLRVLSLKRVLEAMDGTPDVLQNEDADLSGSRHSNQDEGESHER